MLNEFGAYLRERQAQANSWKRDDLAQLSELISNNADIVKSYTTAGFIYELQLLEDQFNRQPNDVAIALPYKIFCERIERFVGQVQLPADQSKVFYYLYASALGKYLALTTQQSNMIIDIEAFLELKIETMKDSEKATPKMITDHHRNLYRQEIDTSCDDISSLVNLDMLPAIDKMSSAIDESLQTLMDEIAKQRQNAGKQGDEYIKQQQELKKQAALRTIFGSLQFIGQALSVMGPFGHAANAVISGTTQIADGLIAVSTVKTSPILPEGAKAALDSFSKAYKRRSEDKLRALHEALDNAKKLAEGNPEALANFEKQIDELKVRINAPGDDLTKFIGISHELQSAIEKQIKNTPGKQQLVEARNMVKLMQLSFDMYKRVRHDERKTEDDVCKALELSQANITALRNYEAEINSKLWPVIDEMRSSLSKLMSEPPVESGAVFPIKKWNIQTILRNLKSGLSKLPVGWDAHEELLQIFLILDDTFATLVNIYDRIDSYADQAKLGDYLACIETPDVMSIPVEDPELQSTVRRLGQTFRTNILRSEYKSATDAFKYTVFPFITAYLDQYYLPTNVQPGDNLSILIHVAISQLNKIRSTIAEYNHAVINGHDQFVYSAIFDPRLQSSSAFFEWHFEEHRRLFADLFSGKRISLRADIRRAPQPKFNAIKFNAIELLFRAPDAQRQQRIDDLLSQFDITLTHLGNSYYRCGSDIYVIHGPSQTISYSCEKHNGAPIRTNNVYNKILQEALALSPYATWSIQLNPPRDETVFAELAQLAEDVDLVLIGRGRYVDDDESVCGDSLKQYYQTDETSIGL